MRVLKRPERAEFDNSDEFLEELNHFHFGSSEEARELVEVDSEEVRHANYKTPVRRVLPTFFPAASAKTICILSVLDIKSRFPVHLFVNFRCVLGFACPP